MTERHVTLTIEHCHIISKTREMPFADGENVALDGYAIIPAEVFLRMGGWDHPEVIGWLNRYEMPSDTWMP
jgi:hypothetical protein